MTTVIDSRIWLDYLNFLSKVYIFPYDVIPSSGKIVLFRSFKKGLWNVLYFLSVVHALYTFFHLIVTVIFFQETIVLYHLPVQFVGALAPLLFHLSFKPSLVSNPDVIKIIFNEMFDREQSRTSPRKWRQLHILELLGLYGSPGIMTALTLEYWVVICIEPTLSHLIINIGLLKQFKSNVVFIVGAYCFEAFSSAIFLIHIGFFMSLLIGVIFKVVTTMEGIELNLKKRWYSTSNIHKSLKTFKNIWLYLQIFNIINKWFLQMGKLVSILGAIEGAVFALRFRPHPLIYIICIDCYIGCCVVYCVFFTIGNSVADSQQRTKLALFAATRHIRDKAERREVMLTLRALPCTGLKVGEFHEIEKNSAMVYLDYVHNQIISLLLL